MKTTRRRRPYVTKSAKQKGYNRTKADIRRKAMRPGWRISKSGKRYYENRANRTDRMFRPF